jgi:hypothetical protein
MKKFFFLFIVVLLVIGTVYSQENLFLRDEFGNPDINGFWNFNDATPFERPKRFGTREFLSSIELEEKIKNTLGAEKARERREADLSDRVIATPTSNPGAYNDFWSDYEDGFLNTRTSIIVFPEDGRIPAIREGVSTQLSPPHANGCNTNNVVSVLRPVRISFGALSCDRPEDFSLASRCLFFPQTTGPYIKANSYNNNIQIVVTNDYVVLYSELGNDPRIIPFGARPGPHNEIDTWTGNSTARWDDDVLVVETKNFSDKLASIFMRMIAIGSAEDMILTEKFIKKGEGALVYEFVISDPGTFESKIHGITHFSRLDGVIYEFACHEGNYAFANILRAARLRELEQNINSGSSKKADI